MERRSFLAALTAAPAGLLPLSGVPVPAAVPIKSAVTVPSDLPADNPPIDDGEPVPDFRSDPNGHILADDLQDAAIDLSDEFDGLHVIPYRKPGEEGFYVEVDVFSSLHWGPYRSMDEMAAEIRAAYPGLNLDQM